MTWEIREPGSQDDGYTKGLKVKPDLEAAKGCRYCKGEGYLVCVEPHFVVHKRVNVETNEVQVLGHSDETCFGHLCTRCQPAAKLMEERLRQ